MFPVYKNPQPCTDLSSFPNPKLNDDSNNNSTNQNPISRDEVQNPTATATTCSMFTLAIGSWLRSRRSRLFFLLLCSPILLPLLFACFPVLCAVEVCIRICRRGRGKSVEDESLRRCEEGCCGCGGGGEGEGEESEVGLLQRYLEDQLMLVGSVYDCADRDDDEDEDQNGCRAPLLG